MKKIYNSKAFWMIVSLLASLAIWVYVTSVETDESKTTFRGVKVELVGEDILRDSKNLVVTDMDTSTVTVEVVGPRRIIGSLSSDQLVAQVDVSKLSRAAYTSQQYTIVYPDGTDTSKLSENRRTPETINFMVSAQTSKSIQVRGSFDGSLAEGYTAEMPVFEPSTITITGSEAYLKDVEYAWVTFSKENVDSTYSVETGFTLMDANNEPCSTTGISFSTDVVTATLPLLTLKEVNLDVNIIEGAGATKANTKITIDPVSVTLAGDSSLLAGMNKIILATIDLTDFSSTFTETYTIPIDNELKNTTGVTKATVTVEIVGLETKTFRVTNFSCINATEGYEADIITESKEITLRGTPEALAQIKDENIRAVADLTDYKESTGTYMPQVRVYVDGFTDVGAIGENTISIEIRKVS
ncbi:MAG: CdaR family protein [Candidatus Limivicinus sp.]|nr:CdaR family protein [Clostridiales bacterium]MDY4225158.1 CdaR family protein [Candidatus Limivicinus sp.]MDY5082898.1 CdaR family protein [Candidatus Limivicinus sp.]